MTETALDAIVERVGYYHSDWGYSLDGSTRTAKNLWPDTFSQALQDPRYIQHCEEQDRKEEIESAIRIVPLDLRAINRKLAGHNDPLGGGDTSALDFLESPEYLAQRRSFVIGNMMDE